VIAGTSVYGIENLGDEALLTTLVRDLHLTIEDLEITWFARHPDQDLAKLYNIQNVIKNLDHDSKEESIGRWFWGLNPADPTDHLHTMWKSIEDCDLLIIGGDPFHEIAMDFYRGLAPQAALLITLAKFLEKPVMLYSIHMGRPLETDLGKELAKFCISNSTVVTLRETFSKKVLEDMGIPTQNTVVVADSAWSLDPFDSDQSGKDVLKREGIEIDAPRIIGFNFRHQYWLWSEEEWAPYRETLIQLADYMVEAYDADILFIPNCTYEIDAKYSKYQDDRPGQKEIVSGMKNKNRAHQILNKYNMYETLSVFRLLDMHFSNRRHSLVFSAVHGVPPVACGGEWHIKPAMEELGLGEYFVNFEDMAMDKLKKSCDATWENRKQISSNILSKLPGLRDKAHQQAEIAKEIIV